MDAGLLPSRMIARRRYDTHTPPCITFRDKVVQSAHEGSNRFPWIAAEQGDSLIHFLVRDLILPSRCRMGTSYLARCHVPFSIS
jgi:hypothetical protein